MCLYFMRLTCFRKYLCTLKCLNVISTVMIVNVMLIQNVMDNLNLSLIALKLLSLIHIEILLYHIWLLLYSIWSKVTHTEFWDVFIIFNYVSNKYVAVRNFVYIKYYTTYSNIKCMHSAVVTRLLSGGLALVGEMSAINLIAARPGDAVQGMGLSNTRHYLGHYLGRSESNQALCCPLNTYSPHAIQFKGHLFSTNKGYNLFLTINGSTSRCQC